MTGVEWRPVPGYEGLYEVSSDGQVKRVAAGAARTPPGGTLKLYGHGYVVLSRDGKTHSYRVGRLVAAAFLGFTEGRIYHANGDSDDNRVENLVIVLPGVCKLCGRPRTGTSIEALCRECLNATKLRLRRIREGKDPDAPVRRGRTDKCLKCGAPRDWSLGRKARCRACYNAEQREYHRNAPVRQGGSDQCATCGQPRDVTLGYHARCRPCFNAQRRMSAASRRAPEPQAS